LGEPSSSANFKYSPHMHWIRETLAEHHPNRFRFQEVFVEFPASNHGLTLPGLGRAMRIWSAGMLLSCAILGGLGVSLSCSGGGGGSSDSQGHYALTVTQGTGTSGTPSATETYPAGTVVNYSYSPASGYQSLVVLVDGGVAAASGSILMNQAHSISTTASLATLIINEVVKAYYTDDAVGIEVYNPTGSAVDLSQYSLRSGSRTNDEDLASPVFPSAGIRTFSLPSLSIPAGSYAVIRGKMSAVLESGGATVYLDDGVSTPHYPWFSNTGFVELLKGGQTADFLRWGSDTNTPTTPTFTFSGSLPAFGSGASYIGYSLARDASSTCTRASTDWTMRAWNTLGGRNDVTTDIASDNDGIPDSAKAADGTFAGLPLYAWGARTTHKDIFIHIDYMVNGSVGATDPGIIPKKEALDKVVATFAIAGYHIHFDVGDLYGSGTANYNLDGQSHAVPYAGSVSFGKATGYANIYQYKNAYMPLAKGRVFHYMLFGDSQNLPASGGSSGRANLPGNTSVITLGHWGLTTTAGANLSTLVNYQAATVMHEFGHNLNLRHGGDENDNWKPNYYSIMNYMYQLRGLPAVGISDDTRYYNQLYYLNGYTTPYEVKADRANWTDGPANGVAFKMNYSDGTGSVIDENAVVETTGIGRVGSLPIDFNNDGTFGTIPFDIRYMLDPSLASPPTRKALHDFNDWNAIDAVFQRSYYGFNLGVTSTDTSLKVRSISENKVSPDVDCRRIFNDPLPPLSDPCAPDPRRPTAGDASRPTGPQ
jgi:hypothetical protein